MSQQLKHTLTDRQLVDSVLAGDMHAFRSLVETTQGLVAQIVGKLIRTDEDRKDVAQDVYLKVFHSLRGFRFQSKLSTWVGQVAYNTCLNRLQKKQLTINGPPETAALGASTIAYAQDKPEPLINREFIFDVVHIIAVLLIIYLVSSFILQLVRFSLDYQLKNKLVERNTDENIVGQIVREDKATPLNTVMQWICTLFSVGVGFVLIVIARPGGLLSLAIMAFCVAGGLGLYFLYAKRSKN